MIPLPFRWYISALAVLLLATLVALQHHKSFSSDEVFELRNLSINFSVIAQSPDGFPPLFRWGLSIFAEAFGESNSRFFSALTSVAGLIFVANSARQFSDSSGKLAGLFYTFSACQLEYAQQARAYSLYICLGAIVLWSAIRLLVQEGWFAWIALVVASMACMWTHYHATLYLALVWGGMPIVHWWQARNGSSSNRGFIRHFVVAILACIVLSLPWFAILQIDLRNPPPIEAINRVDFTGVAYTYLTLIQGWCIGPSQLELYEWDKGQAISAILPWASLSSAFMGMIVLSACRNALSKNDEDTSVRKTDRSMPIWIVLVWISTLLVLMPLGAAVIAKCFETSFVPRYMAVLIVPVSLLFGLGARLDKFSWLTIASWGLILLNLVSFASRNFSQRYDRENYRQLVDYVRAQDDAPRLLVLSHYLGHTIEYQSSGIEVWMVGMNSDEPDDWPEIRSRLAKQIPTNGRFWIASEWLRPDDPRSTKRDMIAQELGAELVQRISGTLELYVVPSSR